MQFVKRHEIVLAVLVGISVTAIGMIVILVATKFALAPLLSLEFKHSSLGFILIILLGDLNLLLGWAWLRKAKTTQRNKRQEIVLLFLGGTSVTAIGITIIVLVASQFVSAPLWSLMVIYTVLVISLANLLLFAVSWFFKDAWGRKVRTTQRKGIDSAQPRPIRFRFR